MSAESHAEEMFDFYTSDGSFLARLRAAGVQRRSDVVVVDASTPVGEVVSRCDGPTLVAVYDEDAPHRFDLARVEGAAAR